MAKRLKAKDILLRILCAALFVIAGLVHGNMSFAAVQQPDLTAYVLPDGTLPELCTTDGADERPVKHVDHDCEACRLAAGILMPLPLDQAGEILRVATDETFPTDHERYRRLVCPPSALPRGPPDLSDFI